MTKYLIASLMLSTSFAAAEGNNSAAQVLEANEGEQAREVILEMPKGAFPGDPPFAAKFALTPDGKTFEGKIILDPNKPEAVAALVGNNADGDGCFTKEGCEYCPDPDGDPELIYCKSTGTPNLSMETVRVRLEQYGHGSEKKYQLMLEQRPAPIRRNYDVEGLINGVENIRIEQLKETEALE